MKIRKRLARKVRDVKRELRYKLLLQKQEQLQDVKANSLNTIALFTNPRGGSTWLAEQLSLRLNAGYIFEPFYRGRYDTFGNEPITKIPGKGYLNNLKFWYYQPIPERENWPEARSTLDRLFNRKNFHPAIWHQSSNKNYHQFEKVVVKFCYANLMLPWLTQHFNIASILLVRHPCAVINSQLRCRNDWDKVKEHPAFNIPQCQYNAIFKKYESVLKTIKHPEENLAATWAFTMLTTIMHPKNNINWLTVSYESLLQNPEYEAQRINDRYHLNLRLSNDDTFQKSSATKVHQDKVGIDKWKKQLTKTQVARIFSILDQFGIDTFDANPFPDLSRLYHGENILPQASSK